MGHIKAENLTLGYSRKKVIQGIDLTIKKGEFLSIIGPSGVGKSTLLMGLNATTSILDGQSAGSWQQPRNQSRPP